MNDFTILLTEFSKHIDSRTVLVAIVLVGAIILKILDVFFKKILK